ncbi:sugar porter family MFS transporter [Allomuricauda sp. M10]|uniref:sugar porter family MFS transporter n=1 Tax=Allomuricauda sp. M10 TaxID=2683292 RepID=UPI001D181E26|nr:sugar porter family MFS transporter [Muricauda sp. M10]
MKKIWLWSVVAALAGFLFGFDTVVISGADRTLQEIWDSSDMFHGVVVMSMALWGTVLGAIFGGIPTGKWGRKKTLMFIGVLYTISAIGSALANDPITFSAFRFLGGLGVGASTIAAPAYITEISPKENRGKLVAMYQFNIVFGILVAFLSNYLLSGIGEQAWRWMMGVEALPAILYTLLTFIIPESPRWLLSKNQSVQAENVLRMIDPNTNVSEQIQAWEEGEMSSSSKNIYQSQFRFPLVLAFLIAFFNQFSGINAFLYYAPRLFEEAGLENSTALLSSIGIGVVNMLFTLLGLFLIDRLGRKRLMLIGSVGYLVSLSLAACAFLLKWEGTMVPPFLFLFIASHAIGQGTVIWVFISEIFPTQVRASGQSFGSSVHWILAAIIPSFIPSLFSSIGPGTVFLFFDAMMLLQLLFVVLLMPETKGKSLEAITASFKTKNIPDKISKPAIK